MVPAYQLRLLPQKRLSNKNLTLGEAIMTTAKYLPFRVATKFRAALFFLSTAVCSQVEQKQLFQLQVAN